MRKRGFWRYSRLAALSLVIAVGAAGPVWAQTSSSTTYMVTESQLGKGGANANSCSGQYCSRTTIGDGTGSPASSPGTIQFTPYEDNEPRLEVIIEPGESNLGVISTSETASKTSAIKVNNYLVGGYTIQIFGDPPKFSGHTISALTTKTLSSAGKEQFGINLAANSAPNVGVEPVQFPSDGTIFGAAEDDYNDANYFKYVSGEVVARSDAESGRTDFTITFIFNISPVTPAANYRGDYTAVVIPAF